MKIQYKDYKDKILGCLYGKNIGGTLGALLDATAAFTM